MPRPRGPGGPGFHRPPPPPPPPHRPYRPHRYGYRSGCLPGCLLYAAGAAGMIAALVALFVSAVH